jgi:hypothetical protein
MIDKYKFKIIDVIRPMEVGILNDILSDFKIENEDENFTNPFCTGILAKEKNERNIIHILNEHSYSISKFEFDKYYKNTLNEALEYTNIISQKYIAIFRSQNDANRKYLLNYFIKEAMKNDFDNFEFEMYKLISNYTDSYKIIDEFRTGLIKEKEKYLRYMKKSLISNGGIDNFMKNYKNENQKEHEYIVIKMFLRYCSSDYDYKMAHFESVLLEN